MNARIVTPWEQGEDGTAIEMYLSFSLSVTVHRPGRLFLLDGYSHEPISETVALEPGTHHLTIKLTRPARRVQWVFADSD